MKNPKIAALFAVLAFGGCMYPKAAEPPAVLTAAELETVRAKYPDIAGATVTAGRDLFVAHCNECHDHPDILAIEDGEWPEIIEEMGHEAKLDKAQSDSVLKFVQAVRAARAKAK